MRWNKKEDKFNNYSFLDKLVKKEILPILLLSELKKKKVLCSPGRGGSTSDT